MKFLLSLVYISLISYASTPAYAEDLLPMPPMPAAAPAQKTTPVDEDVYAGMLQILTNVAIENAKLCAGPSASQTWHCGANVLLEEVQKRHKAKQNNAEPKPK